MSLFVACESATGRFVNPLYCPAFRRTL